jgi:hypothetical protein
MYLGLFELLADVFNAQSAIFSIAQSKSAEKKLLY